MMHSKHKDHEKKVESSKSLFKLLEKKLLQAPIEKVLEAGHGNEPYIALINVPKKYAFDLMVPQNVQGVQDGIFFFSHNATDDFPHKEFDLILDSHLAHCLKGQKDIENYFLNCFNALNRGGSFVGEIMIRSKNFDTHFSGKDTSMRTILEAQVIETMLLKVGFRIEYFYIPYGRRFILENHLDVNERFHPDVLEFIAKK